MPYPLDDATADLDAVLEDFDRALLGPPAAKFLERGSFARVAVAGFWRLANAALEPAGTLADSRYFESDAFLSADTDAPCNALDYVGACVFRAESGVGVLGIVTVAGVDHTGWPPHRQAIDELIDALHAELERALALHRDVFAEAGELPPIPRIATAGDILDLLAAARPEGCTCGRLSPKGPWL